MPDQNRQVESTPECKWRNQYQECKAVHHQLCVRVHCEANSTTGISERKGRARSSHSDFFTQQGPGPPVMSELPVIRPERGRNSTRQQHRSFLRSTSSEQQSDFEDASRLSYIGAGLAEGIPTGDRDCVNHRGVPANEKPLLLEGRCNCRRPRRTSWAIQ